MAAPVGNQNAAKAKVWAAAIQRALDRRKPADERLKAIDELAEKLLDMCAAGELAALQELGNRLDGKPAQAIEIDGELRHRDISDEPLSPDQWADRYSVASAARTTESTN